MNYFKDKRAEILKEIEELKEELKHLKSKTALQINNLAITIGEAKLAQLDEDEKECMKSIKQIIKEHIEQRDREFEALKEEFDKLLNQIENQLLMLDISHMTNLDFNAFVRRLFQNDSRQDSSVLSTKNNSMQPADIIQKFKDIRDREFREIKEEIKVIENQLPKLLERLFERTNLRNALNELKNRVDKIKSEGVQDGN